MATPLSMILSSLVYTGAKTIGATLTTAEQTHHLSRLNAMLESWSLDSLMCYQLVQESFPLTSSIGSYTIGSGGAFNTARPAKIVDPCFIRDSASIDSPVEIIDAKAYGRLSLKSSDGSYPRALFYDAAFVAGLATVYLYPEPAASLTLYINSWKALQSFATIGETVVLPPGYQLAIESNYAINAAAGFRAVPTEVAKIARDSKAAIMSVNAPAGVLRMPAGIAGGTRSNILEGA
jgi:hypothetical protein